MNEGKIEDVNKLKEEVKDVIENGKDYNSAEELFDDVLDMKHYCTNCESDFEGVGDGTCPECEKKFEEQRWWEGEFNAFFKVRKFNEGKSASWSAPDYFTMINFIKQVEDKAREERDNEWKQRVLKYNSFMDNGVAGRIIGAFFKN